jgi:large subunit ribosomal protein L10
MNREQKETAVAELATELGEAQAIFAVDYRGISVPQAAELRAELRGADTAFRVVKNRLTLRAADKAGTEPLKDWLVGPTALALVRGDAALAAKALSKLGSEFNVLSYKGGLMDGEVLEPDQFEAIAKLPGRDQLNAQFAGMVASPLVGLVRGLGSMISGLALQLGQIAEQGLVTGEAPPEPKEELAAEAEAPPEEETQPEGDAGDSKESSPDAPEPDAPAGEAEEPAVDAGEAEEPSVEEEEPAAEAEAPTEEKQTEPEAEAAGEAGDSKEPSTDEPKPDGPAGEAEEPSVDAGEAEEPSAEEEPAAEAEAPTEEKTEEKTEPEADAEGDAGDSKEPSTDEPEPADPAGEAEESADVSEESAVDNEEDE